MILPEYPMRLAGQDALDFDPRTFAAQLKADREARSKTPMELPFDPEPAVSTDVMQRAALLGLAIGHMATLSRRDGFDTANRLPGTRQRIERFYGKPAHADGMLTGSNHNITTDERGMADAFNLLFDTSKMVDAGYRTADEAAAETAAYRSAFKDRYQGVEGRGARDNDRKLAVRAAKIITKQQANRKLRTNPPSRQEIVLPISEKLHAKYDSAPTMLPLLNKSEKLQIFDDDERLRFFPATNKEEEQARRALNYLDDRFGVHRMLDEIDDHIYKEARKKDLSYTVAKEQGDVARKSVIGEWVAHWANAKVRINNLNDLEQQLGGLFPKLKLGEAIGESHPGLAAVLADLDCIQLKTKGKESLGFDPLLGHRNEAAADGNPLINKIVEDAYSGTERSEFMTRRLKEWSSTITVAEAMPVLLDTINRQKTRADFWAYVISQTKGSDKNFARKLIEAEQTRGA